MVNVIMDFLCLLNIGRKKLQHFIPSRFRALKYQRILKVATIEETVDTWVIEFSNENLRENLWVNFHSYVECQKTKKLPVQECCLRDHQVE